MYQQGLLHPLSHPEALENDIGQLLLVVALGKTAFSGVRALWQKGVGFFESRTESAAQLALRARVLANIAESKAARETSNFPVLTAKIDQIASGYLPDAWEMIILHKGDLVYGGLPGQSAFYTTEETVFSSNFEKEALFQSLQVKPNANFGYRPLLGKYVVTKDIRVPFGSVKANPQLGEGLANQYFITNFEHNLDLVETLNLRSSYDNGLRPNRPRY